MHYEYPRPNLIQNAVTDTRGYTLRNLQAIEAVQTETTFYAWYRFQFECTSQQDDGNINVRKMGVAICLNSKYFLTSRLSRRGYTPISSHEHAG